MRNMGWPEKRFHERQLREAMPLQQEEIMERGRLICGCLRLYEGGLRQAVREGARSYDDLQQMTMVGTSCGNCRVLVERVLREELARLSEKSEESRE